MKALPYFLSMVAFFAGVLIFDNLAAKANSERFLVPPPEGLEHMTFGFADSMADSLWLRWIQDNDVCQIYRGVTQPNESSSLAVPEGFENPRHKICDHSWAFKMLEAITTLAPKFKMPYEFGAITLSVAVEDYEGASVIFLRGVDAYPDDWVILYRAAYHFLFDRGDLKKAAELLTKAGESREAPYWLNLMAARLYTKAGQAEIGIQALESYRKTVLDQPDVVKQVDRRITAIKSGQFGP